MKARLGFNKRLILTALSLSVGGLINVEMVMAPYLTALGGSLLTVGVLYSLRGLIGLLFRLPAGFLSDRLGRKLMLLVCSGLRALGSLILALASRVYDALYAVAARSIANVSENPAYLATVGELVEDGSIGIAFGVALSLRNIPSIISPVVTGFIADSAGFRMLFLVSVTAYIISLSLILLFVKESKVQTLKGYGFRELLRDRRLLLIFTAFLLVFSGQTAFTPFFNILVVDYIGLSFSQLGLITSLGAATALMTRIASGWLSDKLTPRIELILAGGFRIVSYILATCAYSFPLLFLTYLVNRLLIFAPARNTMIVRMVPSELRGRAFALMGLAGDLGRIIGATVAGLLAELYGIGYPFYFMAITGIAFIALISTVKESY